MCTVVAPVARVNGVRELPWPLFNLPSRILELASENSTIELMNTG